MATQTAEDVASNPDSTTAGDPAVASANSDDVALTDEKLKRLRTAVRLSYKKLKYFRDQRLKAIEQYVGSHYAKDGPQQIVPINMVELEINTYVRALAARAPKVSCGTTLPTLKPTASKLELGMNHLLHSIRMESTMKSVVLSAFLGLGVVKIGLADDSEVVIDGVVHTKGEPFVDNIDLDNLVMDMTATKFEHAQFIGDKYRLPLDFVQNCPDYDPEAVKKLRATPANAMFDSEYQNDKKVEDIGKGKRNENSEDEEFEPTVELWDIYLPRDNKMITLAAEGTGKPLREFVWEGPEQGPYRTLVFSEVPNNILPLPPIAKSIDIHELVNSLIRKIGRQAERQKDVTIVKAGQEKDGEAVRDADDGDMISSSDPNGVQTAKYGGVDQASLALVLQLRNIFSYQAGNLDTIGGLAPQTDTVGQEKLLEGGANKRVAEMQDRTVDFALSVIMDLAWYLWNDPLIDLPLTKRVAGTNISIPVRFTPEDRKGDFMDYNLKIVAYSMQDQTPSMKLSAIQSLLQNFIAPFAPMLQQQGIAINFQGLMRIVGKLMNIDQLDEILTFQQPTEVAQMIGQPPSKMGGFKPPETKRTYERVNRPGATPQGASDALSQVLLGGRPQKSEMAAIGRPTT